MNPFERVIPGPSRRNNSYRRPNQTSGDASSSSRAGQRRKKSRSPDALRSHIQVPTQRYDPAQPETGKKKKQAAPLPLDDRPFLVPIDDGNSERGRKYKSKSRQQGRQGTEPLATTSAFAVENRSKKDRSKSRDASRRQIQKAPGSDSEGVQALVDLHLDYQGPITSAEFAKLKRELEMWKKVSKRISRFSSSNQ